MTSILCLTSWQIYWNERRTLLKVKIRCRISKLNEVQLSIWLSFLDDKTWKGRVERKIHYIFKLVNYLNCIVKQHFLQPWTVLQWYCDWLSLIFLHFMGTWVICLLFWAPGLLAVLLNMAEFVLKKRALYMWDEDSLKGAKQKLKMSEYEFRSNVPKCTWTPEVMNKSAFSSTNLSYKHFLDFEWDALIYVHFSAQ